LDDQGIRPTRQGWTPLAAPESYGSAKPSLSARLADEGRWPPAITVLQIGSRYRRGRPLAFPAGPKVAASSHNETGPCVR